MQKENSRVQSMMRFIDVRVGSCFDNGIIDTEKVVFVLYFMREYVDAIQRFNKSRASARLYL